MEVLFVYITDNERSVRSAREAQSVNMKDIGLNEKFAVEDQFVNMKKRKIDVLFVILKVILLQLLGVELEMLSALVKK